MPMDFKMTYIYRVMDDIDKELETFQWAFPDRANNRGEIHVDRDEQRLVLEVWCRDNEDPDNEEFKQLIVSQDITSQDPREQIRSIIHNYLCHEADEQMWFGEERPFHPHQTEDK